MEEITPERDFELRSEKVRSVVGRVPSIFIRYGITAITGALIVLIVVAHFLPYKQVFSGVASIYAQDLPNRTDTATVRILLRFQTQRPDPNLSGVSFCLITTNGCIEGELYRISPIRDTLERQEAYCRFYAPNLSLVANKSVDFYATYSSSSLLDEMLGRLFK